MERRHIGLLNLVLLAYPLIVLCLARRSLELDLILSACEVVCSCQLAATKRGRRRERSRAVHLRVRGVAKRGWRGECRPGRKCSRGGRGAGVRFFFFQAEDGIRDLTVTGVQTCALPI